MIHPNELEEDACERIVHNSNILREPIENSPDRVFVEESDVRGEHCLDHVPVKNLRGLRLGHSEYYASEISSFRRLL